MCVLVWHLHLLVLFLVLCSPPLKIYMAPAHIQQVAKCLTFRICRMYGRYRICNYRHFLGPDLSKLHRFVWRLTRYGSKKSWLSIIVRSLTKSRPWRAGFAEMAISRRLCWNPGSRATGFGRRPVSHLDCLVSPGHFVHLHRPEHLEPFLQAVS